MDIETTPDSAQSASATNTLRKGSLSTLDAMAQSIALLALVMGTALSTSLAAGSAGAATPLAFLVVGLTSLCLAYVIIRFTRRSASAGSVYTYIAQGLGPQVGFVGGWMYGGALSWVFRSCWPLPAVFSPVFLPICILPSTGL